MSESSKLRYSTDQQITVFEGFFKVEQFRFTYDTFAGDVLSGVVREVFRRGAAVGVLLVDAVEQKLILVEQFRAGAAALGAENPWLIEMVAGIVEPGEPPEAVALRESEEEAGCIPIKLFPIHEYWVSPGGSDEKFYLFCGLIRSHEATLFGGLEDEHEDIKVHCISFEEAFKWLEQGRLNNAMTLIGIQWLRLNQGKLCDIGSEFR